MTDVSHDHFSVTTLPHRLKPARGEPFSRSQLALFAGGSGDHNPIHIDTDVAKAKGFDDVIVPGMLLMAQLGKVLTDWAGPSSIRRWNVRFTAMTPVLATPTYFAELMEEIAVAGKICIRAALWVEVDGVGEVMRGEALIAKPE